MYLSICLSIYLSICVFVCVIYRTYVWLTHVLSCINIWTIITMVYHYQNYLFVYHVLILHKSVCTSIDLCMYLRAITLWFYKQIYVDVWFLNVCSFITIVSFMLFLYANKLFCLCGADGWFDKCVCIDMYVCMFVCLYVCLYVCMYVCLYTMPVLICICLNLRFI